MNFNRFCSEGIDEKVWLLECLQQEWFVWSSNCYQKLAVFTNLLNFCLKFKYNPLKILEKSIVFLFLIISQSFMVKIEASGKNMWLQVFKKTKKKEKKRKRKTTPKKNQKQKQKQKNILTFTKEKFPRSEHSSTM